MLAFIVFAIIWVKVMMFAIHLASIGVWWPLVIVGALTVFLIGGALSKDPNEKSDW